jgi:crossover junction endodeoxyribonuclease RusA
MDVLTFEMPYPPSINHYYIRSERGVILGERGRAYRDEVYYLLHKHRNAFTSEQRLAVTIHIFAPDNRCRDIDNLAKGILDSLQHAKIFPDDNQIDKLCLVRCNPIKGGKLMVWINEC